MRMKRPLRSSVRERSCGGCYSPPFKTSETSETHRPVVVCCLLCLLIFVLVTSGRDVRSQSSASVQSAAAYSLTVPVDEVVLTFHAADIRGLPINDLKLDELSFFDNGKPPRKILAFQSLQDLPIRAGILIDESESVEQDLSSNRAISAKYAERLLRQQTDQAFVMDFASLSQIAQPWTNDPTTLAAGLRKFIHVGRRIPGTTIFDTIYRACLNQFGHVDYAGSGNFILLFSDGEDNASHASLKEAITECQHTNTAIYSFLTKSGSSFSPTGPVTLAQLASQSGGRVFLANDSDEGIDKDLRMIDADLRNQYRLIYRPAELKHDGSFHRIELHAPERVDTIIIRTGYYALAH